MSEIVNPPIDKPSEPPNQGDETNASLTAPASVPEAARTPLEAGESAETASETFPPSPAIAPLPPGSRRAQRAQRSRQPPLDKPEKGGRKRNYTLITVVSTLRSMIMVFAVAVIVGTIFTSFTSNESLSAAARNNLAIAQVTEERRQIEPTSLPTPAWFNRIGIVPGHSGIATYGITAGHPDPGATCPDGFTELQVTTAVASKVVAALRGRGYTVDVFDEWDLKLDHPEPYQGAAFLSLHADSCGDFNDGFKHSGFKLSNPTLRATVRDQDLRFMDCLRDHYGTATGLPYAEYSVTENMTNYHSFHQIAQRTPAGIIELGFLHDDRDVLQNHADKLAQGIVNGLLCFLDPKSLATNTPLPTASRPASTTPAATALR